jgi:Amt family ammonium transporter
MSAVNTIWVLLGAALVFFMQAGFAMVEAGFTRAKNAGNIIMKNIMDLSIGSVLYWFLGFGIMFGTSSSVFGGLDFFTIGNYDSVLPSGVPLWAFFIFQTVFCATAATIVSGAMAERTKFSAYCIYSAVISLLIYPISGHWIWGGGFLANMGFHDFAGSTAVHMVGGVAAFMGAKVIGPRYGKYQDGHSKAIPGHNITLGALGVFILWFCWFGFNGGSTVGMEGESIELAGLIFMNTNLAAAVSVCVTMIFTWVKYKKPDVSMTLNGALAGLVAITAGCDAVNPFGAALIGLFAGVVVVVVIEYIDVKLKVDDPVGAIGVHGVAGALGTVLTGVFAVEGGLLYGGGFDMLGIQILGVLAVALWVGLTSYITFKTVDSTIGLRVTQREEIEGLDSNEHGLENAYADFLPTIPLTMESRNVESVAGLKEEQVDIDEDNVIRIKPAGSGSGTNLAKVDIITRQSKFDDLKKALNEIGVTGMTVTQVFGCGIQKGVMDYYRGIPVDIQLLPKVRIEIVVAAVPVEEVVAVARRVLYSGRIGDGKIFVYDVRDAVKIRTGETGYEAMQGIDA